VVVGFHPLPWVFLQEWQRKDFPVQEWKKCAKREKTHIENAEVIEVGVSSFCSEDAEKRAPLHCLTRKKCGSREVLMAELEKKIEWDVQITGTGASW
jgi:hypothetical protein